MANQTAIKTRRELYDPKYVMSQLENVDAYQWFVERTSNFFDRCAVCKGACEIQVPDNLRNDYYRRQGAETANFMKWVHCDRCYTYQQRVLKFTRLYFANVQPHYQKMFLSNLAPTDKVKSVLKERQQEILDMLKAAPKASYAFFGPAGTSKTTWCVALYAHNLWEYIMGGERNVLTGKHIKWFPVRRITTKRLLDQFTDYALHKNDPEDPEGIKLLVEAPDVTREKVEYHTKQGIKTRLFLEEIDKVKETESRRANLFEVIDAIYEQNGQLVINSNLTPKEFEAQFGKEFARRIGEMCKVINLFPEEKK